MEDIRAALDSGLDIFRKYSEVSFVWVLVLVGAICRNVHSVDVEGSVSAFATRHRDNREDESGYRLRGQNLTTIQNYETAA